MERSETFGIVGTSTYSNFDTFRNTLLESPEEKITVLYGGYGITNLLMKLLCYGDPLDKKFRFVSLEQGEILPENHSVLDAELRQNLIIKKMIGNLTEKEGTLLVFVDDLETLDDIHIPTSQANHRIRNVKLAIKLAEQEGIKIRIVI